MLKAFISLIVFSICLSSCKNKSNKPIIKFSADSSSIVVKGIKNADKLQLKDLLGSGGDLNNYFNVQKVAMDQDSLTADSTVGGDVTILGDSLVFVPTEKFMPGQTYNIKSFIGAEFGTLGTLLTGKGKATVEPQVEKLRR